MTDHADIRPSGGAFGAFLMRPIIRVYTFRGLERSRGLFSFLDTVVVRSTRKSACRLFRGEEKVVRVDMRSRAELSRGKQRKANLITTLATNNRKSFARAFARGYIVKLRPIRNRECSWENIGLIKRRFKLIIVVLILSRCEIGLPRDGIYPPR